MERKKLKIANGETISYFEQGSGPKTLVLIHGNTSSSYYYKPLFERLPKDLRVIAPDLRGFGDSSYQNRFDSLKELAEDIDLLLKALNVEKFALVGWSLGGGVAMELALLNNNVQKLILVASTTHYGYPLYQKDENNQPILGLAYESKEAMALDPVQVLPLLNIIKTQDVNMMNTIYNMGIYLYEKPEPEEAIILAKEALKTRSLIDADWAISSFNLSNTHNGYNMGNGKIKDLKIPTLHILGDKDYMVPEFMLEQNREAIIDSKVIRYQDCAHSPFVDKPDAITNDILAFIK